MQRRLWYTRILLMWWTTRLKSCVLQPFTWVLWAATMKHKRVENYRALSQVLVRCYLINACLSSEIISFLIF